MSASTPAAASQGEPEPRLLNAAGLAELTARPHRRAPGGATNV
jgi:hypothetical protein